MSEGRELEPRVFSLDVDDFMKKVEGFKSGAFDQDVESKQKVAKTIFNAVYDGFYDWEEIGLTEEDVRKHIE